jgi:hypothetical protein
MSLLPLVAGYCVRKTYCQTSTTATINKEIDMGVLILIAILGTALFAVSFGAQKLTDYVRGDGASERASTRTPPRSHHLDPFDPRSRTA